MTPEQVRMGRAALDWTAEQLAEKAELSVNTVRRIEKGRGALFETMEKIRRTFEDAGVVLVPENGGGEGVRFRVRRADRGTA